MNKRDDYLRLLEDLKLWGNENALTTDRKYQEYLDFAMAMNSEKNSANTESLLADFDGCSVSIPKEEVKLKIHETVKVEIVNPTFLFDDGPGAGLDLGPVVAPVKKVCMDDLNEKIKKLEDSVEFDTP